MRQAVGSQLGKRVEQWFRPHPWAGPTRQREKDLRSTVFEDVEDLHGFFKGMVNSRQD